MTDQSVPKASKETEKSDVKERYINPQPGEINVPPIRIVDKPTDPRLSLGELDRKGCMI